MRLLVPLDGSFASERILPWVVDFSKRTHAHVDLLRIVPEGGLSAEREHESGRERDDALRYLDLMAERLSVALEANPQVLLPHAELYVRRGSPVATIRDMARSLRADLIFMATRGATSLRRGFAGSITEQLLRQAPAPMFVVHASDPFAPPSRILVPIDETRTSEMVLPYAEWFGNQILMVNIRPLKHPYPTQTRMEELCETLTRRGIRASFMTASGDPATTLTTLARRKHVDLIAMNGTDARVLSRLFGRSLAEEITRQSSVPALFTFFRKYEPVRNLEPKPLYRMA